ncbi:MAG: CcmD family protein [Acidobacteriota bacterium]
MFQDGNLWLAAVNLIIWTGLFLYLMSLERKIGRREDELGFEPSDADSPPPTAE